MLLPAVLLGAAASSPAATLEVTVLGTSDPWLAGMPDGATASLGDVAPNQSPVEVVGVFTLDTSKPLGFSATGSVNNVGSVPVDPPDGSGSFIAHAGGAENGISDVFAPTNSLVGVFLDATQPDLFPAPGTLDFRATGKGVTKL